MFPNLRQRLLIFLTAIVGGLIWLAGGQWLQPADGASGISLVTAQIGPAAAVGLVALLSLPTLAAGLILSAIGHPLSGVFAVAAAMCIMAAGGGAIDGWLWRAAEQQALPSAYAALIGEMFLWQAGVLLMLTAIGILRSPLRARWPALAYEDHLGVDLHIRLPQLQAFVSGAAATVMAGFIAYMLIRNSDAGQVMWALLIAFTLGACVAHLIFPHSNPIGILHSPAAVAIAAYSWMLFSSHYHNTDQVLSMWHSVQHAVPPPGGLALALPIHYASAGVAGCTLGIGLAHMFETRPRTDDTAGQPVTHKG